MAGPLAVPGRPEAMGAALVPEANKNNAPKKGSVQELGRKLAKQAQEGNYQGGLENLRAPQIEGTKAGAIAEQIGHRNKTTGARERTLGAEKKRYNRTTTAQELTKNFAEQGYDALDATSQQVLQAKVISEVLRDPLRAAELRKISADPATDILTNPKLQAYAERILRDQNLTPKMREAFAKTLEANSNILGDSVDLAEEELQKAENKKVVAEANNQDAQDRLGRTDAEIKKYDRDTNGKPAVGAEAAKRINDLTKKLPDLQREQADYQQQFNDAKQRRDAIQTELDGKAKGLTGVRNTPDILADLKIAQDAVDKAQQEVSARVSQIDELDRLKAREIELRDERPQIAQEAREKDLAFKESQIEVAKRQRELTDVTRIRETQEEDVALAFEDVIPEAVSLLLQDETVKIGQAFDQEAVKLAEQAKTADGKAVYDAMQSQWFKEVRRTGVARFLKGERGREINKTVVSSDYSILLREGPEGVVRRLLESQGYNPTQVAERLTDREFVESVQNNVVKQLLARKLMSSGIDSSDVPLIAGSQWGEGMITEALSARAEVKQALENLIGEGVLNRPGFIGKLQGELKRNPWLWLLLLGAPLAALTLPAGGLLAPAAGIAAAKHISIQGGQREPLADIAA